MINSILFELVRRNMFEEKKSYSNCFANVFGIGSFITLVAANYLYFYCNSKDIGDLIMYSGVLLLASILLKVFYYCRRCKKPNSLMPMEMGSVIEKITPLVPMIIRYVPVSILAFVIVSLVKNKVLSETKKLIKY